MTATDRVLYEDEEVIVRLNVILPGESHIPGKRGDRVVVNLTETKIEKHDLTADEQTYLTNDRGSTHHHKASLHSITNIDTTPHKAIIIEWKHHKIAEARE